MGLGVVGLCVIGLCRNWKGWLWLLVGVYGCKFVINIARVNRSKGIEIVVDTVAIFFKKLMKILKLIFFRCEQYL